MSMTERVSRQSTPAIGPCSTDERSRMQLRYHVAQLSITSVRAQQPSSGSFRRQRRTSCQMQQTDHSSHRAPGRRVETVHIIPISSTSRSRSAVARSRPSAEASTDPTGSGYSGGGEDPGSSHQLPRHHARLEPRVVLRGRGLTCSALSRSSAPSTGAAMIPQSQQTLSCSSRHVDRRPSVLAGSPMRTRTSAARSGNMLCSPTARRGREVRDRCTQPRLQGHQVRRTARRHPSQVDRRDRSLESTHQPATTSTGRTHQSFRRVRRHRGGGRQPSLL